MSTNQPCAEALRAVYPYLDGETTAWKRWVVRRHLRQCGSCGDVYSFEVRLKQMVRERCAEDVPDDVVDRLKAFLRENDCNC